MDRSNTATAKDGRDGDKNLMELHTAVKEAVAFAEEWPEAYRPRAFDLAVERLIGAAPTAAKPAPAGAPAVTPIVTGGLSAVARELGVDPRLLSRAVEIADDGKITVLGRIDGRTKAELQLKYSAVYCYLKEKALGQLNTPIEELRMLCQAHGCYDGNNFTAYFRTSDLLRELGDKGAQARTYRLSTKGVEEAKALLKKMIEE